MLNLIKKQYLQRKFHQVMLTTRFLGSATEQPHFKQWYTIIAENLSFVGFCIHHYDETTCKLSPIEINTVIWCYSMD